MIMIKLFIGKLLLQITVTLSIIGLSIHVNVRLPDLYSMFLITHTPTIRDLQKNRVHMHVLLDSVKQLQAILFWCAMCMLI